MDGPASRRYATTDIAAFKKVVPDALDARGFFDAKGQWSNGEKFSPA